MKPLKIAIGIGLLGTVTLAPTSSPASCPAPTVFLTKASARPGETVVVKGRYWFSGCQDVGYCGCTGCDYGPEERPLKDISLFLARAKGGSPFKPIRLGEVDANKRAAFALEVKLPRVQAGTYRVIAKSADGLSRTQTFRIGRQRQR